MMLCGLVLPAVLGTAAAVEAPITAVTVYSDRARVTRSARLSLSGQKRVELPLLLDTVDPATIRLQADHGEVVRVDIGHLSEGEFPAGEARALLARLEKLDDQIALAQGERAVYQAQVDLLRRVVPGVPQGEPLRPQVRLNPSGWTVVLDFLRKSGDRFQGKVRESDEQARTLQEQRLALVERVRLLGGQQHRSGYRVIATLSGHGSAQVALSYMVYGARWLPTYDIQLWPGKNQVDVLFSGQVSQETGEDWLDAGLTLSTAVPATATQVPRLLTWKIGEQERFIPTPVPVAETVPPPPTAPPLLPPDEGREDQNVLRRLLSRAGVALNAPQPRPQLQARTEGEGKEERDRTKSGKKNKTYDFDQDGVEGDLVRPDGELIDSRNAAPSVPAAPPPPPASPARVTVARALQSAVTQSITNEAPVPVKNVGLLPPSGYRGPSFAANLPAALSGGYDLSYPGLHPDTVRSGKGARRVALFSRTFPVTVSRKLFPALAEEAFLVAEIRNPSAQALPGGQANLFVGADPSGVATLKLVAPGEMFTLPLGLDRAIKPLRNVRLTTVEKGVFSKDEVTEYTVTTEVANPYRVPVALTLTDQVPLGGDKNVEIKLLRTDPAAQKDPNTGALLWRLTVPPGGKAQTLFVYTLRRPKGYRLYQ